MGDFRDNVREETALAAGEAESVMDADRMAWEALESVLGPDPVDAWMLVKLDHSVMDYGKLAWNAKFVRDPEAPSPPNLKAVVAKLSDASKIEPVAEPEMEDEEASA